VEDRNEFYSVYWDPGYRNDQGLFNAVIVRVMQEDRFLLPEVNNVVEGIAILLHSN
jgi:hypothetical protein